MGITGKIFAILTVLAAIAFFVLATLEYGARQAWEMAVTQQDFVEKGLPVDNTEKDEDGQVRADLLGDKKGMAERLFSGAGPAVTTQKEAVAARVNERKTYILEPQDEAERKKRLEAVSLPFARTWGERQVLQTSIRKLGEGDAKNLTVSALLNPGEAQQALEKNDQLAQLVRGANLFTQQTSMAVDGRNAGGAPYNLDEWRQQNAYVLLALADDAQSRQRAVVVCGLTAYVQEVNKQSGRLQAMLPDVQQAETEHRAAFVAQYRELLGEQEYLSNRVKEVQVSIAQQEARKTDHRTQVIMRQKNVDDLNKEIETAKQATEAAVARQAALEKELFEATKKVRDENKANQKLLEEIRTRELGGEGGQRP